VKPVRRPAVTLPLLLMTVLFIGCTRKASYARAAVAAAVVVGRSSPPPLPPPTDLTDGQQLYARFCALCHGPEARGYAADNAPSLVSATFLASASNDFLRAAIGRGRPGTAMAGYGPGVGGPLTLGQMDAILAHLRKGGPPPVPPPPGPIGGNVERGKAVYTAECAKCHGTPTQRLNAVHLANPILLETATDGFLRLAVEEGRPGTPMLPFKGRLGPGQIEDVVAYVRSMAVEPVAPVVPAPGQPAGKRTGPVVLNPHGKSPDFSEFNLKEGRLVSLDAVKEALDRKRRIVIADARPPSDWLNLHIPGAISTPYYDLASLNDIPNDGTWVIAYCACPHHASGAVVDELRKRGYRHTAVLDEGIFAWQQKGYPVIAAPAMQNPPAPPPLPH
jgi:cytochrome c oxidase cbb3-type subunit 3/ubiquinol-cytochrome c reductase cytochrome c subunit